MTPAQARARLRRARGPIAVAHARRAYAQALVDALGRQGVTTSVEELTAIARELEARDAEVARWN